jgi:hypothetical protein
MVILAHLCPSAGPAGKSNIKEQKAKPQSKEQKETADER